MPTLQQALLDPLSYQNESGPLEQRETHISWLFLTPDHVYKIKKPVDLGFCDFSSLGRRRLFCREEVRLNRRLAPETYLEVCRIVKTPEGYAVGGSGPACEYAVKMRRLPAARMLDSRLLDGTSTAELRGDISRIADRLAGFHSRADRIPSRTHKDSAAFELAWQQNFAQTGNCPANLISPGVRGALRTLIGSWFEKHRQLLDQRQLAGYVRDGHGDLHCEHICLTDPLQIIDCIEFNPALRYGDILNDLAFLVMDLQFRGRSELARQLWQTYRAELETGPFAEQLLRAYCLYRAWVRAKIHFFQMELAKEKELHRLRSRKYFQVAAGYALPQLLLLCCGRIGSGKSTLAHDLGKALGFNVLGSDQLRAELFATSESDPRRYCMQERLKVYTALATKAEATLTAGNSLIIDATFETTEMRALLDGLAGRLKIPVHFLQTTCAKELIRARLKLREQTPAGRFGSEAGEAEFDAQLSRYESFRKELPRIEVDTGQPREYNVDFVLEQLLQNHGTL